jgi:acetoin utilization protein AcuB
MPSPIVERYMSAAPVTIAPERTLAAAHRLMREHGIRHLPVVDGGRLVGLLSQRDLYLLETLASVDPAAETVGEAMSAEPYAVGPDAPLERVAATMAKRRIGSAVVLEHGAVVGLFTTTDALLALTALIRRRRRTRAAVSEEPDERA